MNAKVTPIKDDVPHIGLSDEQRKNLRLHKLPQRGLLLTPSVKRFPNSQMDKAITVELCNDQHASANEATVRKKLFSKEQITAVSTPYNQLRDLYRKKLMPWSTGTYFCPAEMYSEFIAEFTAAGKRLDAAVEKFATELEHIIKDRKDSDLLGGMFNESDYPDPDTFRQSWQWSIATSQVPSTDVRVKMDEAAARDVERELERAIADNAAKIWRHAATQLAEGVAHVAKILSDTGEGKARKSGVFPTLLSNLQCQIDMAKGMAASIGDESLGKLAAQVEKDLMAVDTETIKANPAIKDEVARKARNLISPTRGEVAANEAKAEQLFKDLDGGY
jgi:hypothetical protein